MMHLEKRAGGVGPAYARIVSGDNGSAFFSCLPEGREHAQDIATIDEAEDSFALGDGM